jgi:hypothetical protein
MLYKFKSKVAGDVIMLQANGEQILRIIGKEPAAKGIILPEQIPAAIAALEQAIERGRPGQADHPDDAADEKDDTKAADRVTLHQRAAPFIDMLKRCQKADEEIVWGV